MKNFIPETAILGDSERFRLSCELARRAAYNESLPSKIGMLSERRLHSVLKFYYDSDESHHEIKVGRFFADILCQNEIIEIQTGDLGRLRKKLDTFLSDRTVTLVHPLALNTTVCRIDPDTGECISRRKSPVHANIYSAVGQLYKIKPYLTSKNLAIRLIFLSIEEYRTPNRSKRGRHRGSVRLERFPEAIHYEVELAQPEDYKIFIPEGLSEYFTSSDFYALTKCPASSTLLGILLTLGVVERVGKKGNSFIYKVS